MRGIIEFAVDLLEVLEIGNVFHNELFIPAAARNKGERCRVTELRTGILGQVNTKRRLLFFCSTCSIA